MNYEQLVHTYFFGIILCAIFFSSLRERGCWQIQFLQPMFSVRFVWSLLCIIGERYWINRVFIRLTRKQSMWYNVWAYQQPYFYSSHKWNVFIYSQSLDRNENIFDKKNHRHGCSCDDMRTQCDGIKEEIDWHICGICANQNNLLYIIWPADLKIFILTLVSLRYNLIRIFLCSSSSEQSPQSLLLFYYDYYCYCYHHHQFCSFALRCFATLLLLPIIFCLLYRNTLVVYNF